MQDLCVIPWTEVEDAKYPEREDKPSEVSIKQFHHCVKAAIFINSHELNRGSVIFTVSKLCIYGEVI